MMVLSAGRFAVFRSWDMSRIVAFLAYKRPEIPHRFCGAATCRIYDFADNPFPLSLRQIVASRAAVRIDRVSLSLWNQEFRGERAPGANLAGAIGV